jgi:hypothetical protein
VKTVTFEEARAEFKQMFELAAAGETVVIQREDGQRVALRSVANQSEPEIAPRGYFADDYSREDIAELNTFASLAPKSPLP